MFPVVRVGVDVTGFGSYADPALVADVAHAAEEAGWDALFIWDHLAWVEGIPSGDPWISLAAAATATRRIRLGLGVTPLPRRRPQIVATAVTALDRLSGGRIIFGAGLGGTAAEFEAFGEIAEPRLRAAKLDEGLDLLDRLWRGDLVSHRGEHYTVAGLRLAPLPLQRPRPPVWIGGSATPALRRAASWDGYAVGSIVDEQGNVVVEPSEVARRVRAIGRDDPSFDVAVVGVSEPGHAGIRHDYAAAGATWWLESIHDLRGTPQAMLDRVRAGPGD